MYALGMDIGASSMKMILPRVGRRANRSAGGRISRNAI